MIGEGEEKFENGIAFDKCILGLKERLPLDNLLKNFEIIEALARGELRNNIQEVLEKIALNVVIPNRRSVTFSAFIGWLEESEFKINLPNEFRAKLYFESENEFGKQTNKMIFGFAQFKLLNLFDSEVANLLTQNQTSLRPAMLPEFLEFVLQRVNPHAMQNVVCCDKFGKEKWIFAVNGNRISAEAGLRTSGARRNFLFIVKEDAPIKTNLQDCCELGYDGATCPVHGSCL